MATPTQTTTYPEWQTAIREAQASSQALLAEIQRKRDEEAATKQAQVAHDLQQKVLAAGINLPASNIPKWDFGGYTWEEVYGDLRIRKAVPNTLPTDDESLWDTAYVWEVADVIAFRNINAVAIADLLDTLEARAASHASQNADYLTRRAAPTAAAPVAAAAPNSNKHLVQKFFTHEANPAGETQLAELLEAGWTVVHQQFIFTDKLLFAARLERLEDLAPIAPEPAKATAAAPSIFEAALDDLFPDEDEAALTPLPVNGVGLIAPEELGTIAQAILRGEDPSASLAQSIADDWQPFDAEAHMAKLFTPSDTPSRFGSSRPVQISITLDGSPAPVGSKSTPLPVYGEGLGVGSNKPISQALRAHGLDAVKAALDAATFDNFTPQPFSTAEVQS